MQKVILMSEIRMGAESNETVRLDWYEDPMNYNEMDTNFNTKVLSRVTVANQFCTAHIYAWGGILWRWQAVDKRLLGTGGRGHNMRNQQSKWNCTWARRVLDAVAAVVQGRELQVLRMNIRLAVAGGVELPAGATRIYWFDNTSNFPYCSSLIFNLSLSLILLSLSFWWSESSWLSITIAALL